MLSCYQFMKQKLIFITQIFTQGSYFYAEDKNFHPKPSKMLYYRAILRSVFAYVFMYRHELP